LTSRNTRTLWKDIEDILVSRTRQYEKGVPIEKVKTDLLNGGRLRGWRFMCRSSGGTVGPGTSLNKTRGGLSGKKG
jgi:hypothetical protein